MRSLPAQREILCGWGRHEWVEAEVVHVQTLNDILSAVTRCRSDGRPLAIRGAGLSYGDSALNEDGLVLDMTAWAGIDACSKNARRLRVRSGTRLGEVLRVTLPHGRVLAGLPGSSQVTVGGAISHNVHGKDADLVANFGSNVRELTLLMADGTIRHVSAAKDGELFRAVIGGCGLFAIILDATLVTTSVKGAGVRVSYSRFQTATELPALFDVARRQRRMAVAWIDAFNPSARGIFEVGEWTRIDGDAAAAAESPHFPRSSLIGMLGRVNNRMIMRTLNGINYAVGARVLSERTVAYQNFLFPLARVAPEHHRLFPGGLLEIQVFVPAGAFPDAFLEIMDIGRKYKCESWFCGIKRHLHDPHPLAFAGDGYSFTIDLPARLRGCSRFENYLSELFSATESSGGRFNLSKDAVLTAEQFARTYPKRQVALELKQRWDPDGLFKSAMAERLELSAQSPPSHKPPP
jgi:decaprenylphospho-beta-D-ribofuranose 2-oxidase